MTARNIGLLLWLLVGVAAAVAVYWQFAYPPRLPTTTTAASRSPELPLVEPMRLFQLPPLDQYGEIVLHPLFIAAREPEPPPPDDASLEEPAPPGPEQKLTLRGVMITPNAKKALLRSEEPNAKTARMSLGETIGEWRLEAVFSDRVVLRKGQSTQELPLIRPQKSMGPHGRQPGARRGRNTRSIGQPAMVPKPGVRPPPVVSSPPPDNG